MLISRHEFFVFWCYVGLSAGSTAARATAPPVKSVAPRAETQAPPDSSSSSAQPASARLHKSASLNKNTHSQQKSSKAARSDSINDSSKGRRKINEMSSDGHATKPDRDVPVKQKDISVDIRTASHPPQQRLPAVTDVSRPVTASGGQSSDSSSQLSGLIKAEEFLHVSNSFVFCK